MLWFVTLNFILVAVIEPAISQLCFIIQLRILQPFPSNSVIDDDVPTFIY